MRRPRQPSRAFRETTHVLARSPPLSNTHTHTHTTFVRDDPGGPVPQEAFAHSHPTVLCQLPPSTTTHSILRVQFTYLAVLFHNLSSGPLLSLGLGLSTWHPYISSPNHIVVVSQHMPVPSQPLLLYIVGLPMLYRLFYPSIYSILFFLFRRCRTRGYIGSQVDLFLRLCDGSYRAFHLSRRRYVPRPRTRWRRCIGHGYG